MYVCMDVCVYVRMFVCLRADTYECVVREREKKRARKRKEGRERERQREGVIFLGIDLEVHLISELSVLGVFVFIRDRFNVRACVCERVCAHLIQGVYLKL